MSVEHDKVLQTAARNAVCTLMHRHAERRAPGASAADG
jgi:hypothetical protein